MARPTAGAGFRFTQPGSTLERVYSRRARPAVPAVDGESRRRAAARTGRGGDRVALGGARVGRAPPRRRARRSVARWPRRGCCRTTSTRRPRCSAARPTSSASGSRPPHSPRCGGCTAASPPCAAISRAPSRSSAARSSRPSTPTTRAPSASRTTSSAPATGRSAIRRSSASTSSKAASALHAAGDRRHLAPSIRCSGIVARAVRPLRRSDGGPAAGRAARDGCTGRRRARAGLRQPGERRHDATPLRPGARAGRARVSLHEHAGSGHGLAVALATLGQICVRLGDLAARGGRAAPRARRAQPVQFHETTGAVLDTLAQIHLIRGEYDEASHDSSSRPARRTAPTACRPAAGTSGRSGC